MGYFNSKVEAEKVEECTEGFGLGIIKEQGDPLIESCTNNFLITNTLF